MTPRSPLAELLDAVRRGREVCDERLRAAWETETSHEVMWRTAWSVASLRGEAFAFTRALMSKANRSVRCTCTATGPQPPCPEICDAIRAAVRCPEWSELKGVR